MVSRRLRFSVARSEFRYSTAVSSMPHAPIRLLLSTSFASNGKSTRSTLSSPFHPSTRRLMSTHAEITKTVFRQTRTHRCTITEISNLTPTVKSFRFLLPTDSLDASRGEPFAFLSGQWVDFFASESSGVKDVGGFSITSTPAELASDQTFELAVKYSPRNPVASWLHQTAKPGDEVGARVGGEFFWEAGLWEQLLQEKLLKRRESSLKDVADVVFLAGGVGLTPLMSMVSHLASLNLKSSSPERKVIGHVLHSAKESERLFFTRLAGLSESPETRIRTSFFLAGSSSASADETKNKVFRRRLNEDDLRSVLAPRGNYAGTLVFLCGPNSFEAEMLVMLKKIGVPEDRTRFEKWW